MSKLIIKINGEILEFFDNVILSTQINSFSSSLTFDSFYDIKTYEFAKIEAFRDKILIFTGKIFGKKIANNSEPEPFNYQCVSLTGILEDCTLPLESYPLQTKDKTLKEIVENICAQFDIKLRIDNSATSDVNGIYELQDQLPDKKASEIINKLCSQRNLILTHNSKGELLITKKVLGNNAKPNFLVQSDKSYNYRAFYRKYNVLGQQSADNDTTKESSTGFSNIDSKRVITIIQKDGDSSITQLNADAIKFDSYKSNSLTVEYHDFFANVGDIFIIDNVKCICNSMNYNYNSGGETCSLNLLNYKVYQR